MTIAPAEPGFTLALPWLQPWIASQRWYANKGALPMLEEISTVRLPIDAGGAALVHLLLDHSPGKPALYQVPLSYRRSALSSGHIGELDGWQVHDAPHDPEFAASLLEWAIGRREPALSSRVLIGEQSNTSIIYEGHRSGSRSPTPVIIKLFRALHHGENPDVELQTALAAAGSHAVPMPLGSIVAEWPDRGRADGRATGHLAFAQEYLTGAVDAWRVAVAAEDEGVDFSAQAHELGIATAGVHATLAATLPTRPTTAFDIATARAQMATRLEQAISEAPALASRATAINAVFDRCITATWPAQQRIHGDLHLGQVLAVPGRGWIIVDFEGEPLRPMAERSRPDSPLRDVAGMLRSFDYVAGSLTMSGSRRDAREWAASARGAFTEAYSAASGRDIRANGALIDAFELDKALYETVYEARNRPDWLAIPVAAIERLTT